MTFKPVDTAIVMVVGPCLDDTDMKSLEESIAYNAAGIDVSLIIEKTDGTTSVIAITLTTGGTSDWTHIDGGYYEVEVTAAQNAEEGIAHLRGVCTGVLPFESPRYDIVKANVYDSLMKGTDVLQTDVTQLAGVAQSLTDLKHFVDNCYSPSTWYVQTNLQAIQGTDASASDLKDLVDTGYDPVAHKIQGVVSTDEVTALAATGADLILKDSTFALAIADAIWDEILTGATHNIASSAGRRVREIGAYAIHSGTAQAGNTIHLTLAATAAATNGIYNRNLLVIVGGTGAGQTRTIIDYNGTTKVALVDREWRVSPDATSEYQITPDDTPLTVDHGLVQGATDTTITIRDYASSVDNTYLCNIIIILAGTGRGQARLVSAYNGTTKVITICGENWTTVPDIDSVYALIPYGASCVGCLTDDALSQVVAANIAGITDGTNDLQEMMRIMFAALVGKSSGGGTATLVFRDSGDVKDRITATVDINGNRTAITLDGS